MSMRISIIASGCGLALAASAAVTPPAPPDPADPSTWGSPPPLTVVEAPATGFGRAAARARAVTATQRMARVKGEMLAGIEPDGKGGKIAIVVHPDGRTERRPLRVLYTARVKPPAPPAPALPPAAKTAATAAAGAIAGAAATAALRKNKSH